MSESKAIQVTNFVIEKGLSGFGPIASASELAEEYLADKSFKNNDERAWSLIKWETSKNLASGFATGLGGVAILPLSIPVSLGTSWAIQARVAAAIAFIHGHDLKEDRVRTLILLTLLGDTGLKEPIKVAGVTITEKFLMSSLKSLPGSVLTQVNRAVGFRLLTKTGEKGVVNLAKMIPFLGGVVGGTIDGITCYSVGTAAQNVFSPTVHP